MTRLLSLVSLLVVALTLPFGCGSPEGNGLDDDTGAVRQEVRAGAFCGGIAGIACPAGQTCVDDPSDGCDPAQGGADCSGICVGKKVCVQIALCIQGYAWDARSCSCVPEKPQRPACSPRCKKGESCQQCKGVNGAIFVCIPDGAIC